MSQVVSKTIFEIFKRLNRRKDYEWTGIGLALCQKIIHRHKGKIWVDSIEGKGTNFYFTIFKHLKIKQFNLKHILQEESKDFKKRSKSG